jgi:predicted nuclease of restriction endonuclease-like (RecB) superfamily
MKGLKKGAPPLLQEVTRLIEESRSDIAVSVNMSLTALYWKIGTSIRNDILQQNRAGYGEEIVSTLSRQLEETYGRGFSGKNLRHMIRFAEVFEDREKVSTLWRQLSWSHIKILIYMKDPLQIDFYSQMCLLESWSVRTFRNRIDSMLFERTALSKKPEETIRAELVQMTQSGRMNADMVLKDPYVLDFLQLNDRYLEKDLEDAILRELEQFLLELGAGFTFVARQKRIEIDNEDFYIDLLFYNRRLKRLVVIELKLGPFKAAYKGQMELYLRWLSRYEQEEGESTPLGIILCSDKKHEQVELLELDKSGIHVAEYLTVLPEKALLEQKLNQAIEKSRLRLQSRGDAE